MFSTNEKEYLDTKPTVTLQSHDAYSLLQKLFSFKVFTEDYH